MATSPHSSSLGKTAPDAGSARIRVLITDETPMACQLLKDALTRSRFRFEVVGCATRCAEIIELVKGHPVDVTLVSENLQGGPLAGFQALKELQAQFPACA